MPHLRLPHHLHQAKNGVSRGTNNLPATESGKGVTGASLRIVLVYAVFACLWILLSDKAVGLMFDDPAKITLVSMIKGWLFVAVTSLLLYGLIRRLLTQVLTTSHISLEAQKEKMRANQLLSDIANSSPDAIFAKDMEGRYLLFNRETARVFGKSVEHALGCDDAALFPVQAEMIRANDRSVIIENKINTYEETITTVDGERTFLAIKGPLRDEDGNVIGIFGISRDITERKQTEAALRESEQRFRSLFNNAEIAMFRTRLDGTEVLDCNDKFLELVGRTRKEVIGSPSAILWEDPRKREEMVRQLNAEGHVTDLEFGMLNKNGEVRHCLTSLKLSRGNGLLEGSIQDVTERKRAEDALRESRDRFKKVVEHSPLSMALVSTDETIEYINSKAIETFGYEPQDIPHMDRWWVLAYPDESYRAEAIAQWMGLVQEALAQNHEIEQREYRVTCKDGSVKITLIFGVWVGDQVLVVFEDVTNRKQAEEQIRHLAYFDALTELPNRRLLLDRLKQALTSSNRHHRYGALMLLDMDDFKTLNDTLGHDVGDKFLVEVATRLQACVREGDTVARHGGDEFVVILEDLNEDTQAAMQAESVAVKILHAVSQPYLLDLALPEGIRNIRSYHCTSSIGITLFRESTISVDELMKRADTAMYQAKAAGRNSLRFFDPEMQATVNARAALDNDLRQAVQESQFLLYYQPQVDGIGRMTGAEALVRWQHPRRGMVSPAEFIPEAEVTGLILPIGHWVLETACAQLAAWAALPDMSHLTLAVNVSARQFRHPDFVNQVLAIIDSTGANPKKLKLELTESLLLEDVEDIIAKMTALKGKGVGFSLDDFGTGYSSLSYLKRLPLDQLKIDHSFVRDVLSDPNDATIARTIVALAQSMGLAVIAEGVETEEQREFLARNGCLAYQGYFYSRPLPLKEFHEFAQRV